MTQVAPETGFMIEASGGDTAVLLHGWTGSPAHLWPLGQALAAGGISSIAPLLAGHGTSEAHMARTGWRDWVASALQATATAPGDRRHLVGLSMGGLIAILIAAVDDVATITTINTPQKVFSRSARFAGMYRGSARIRVAPDPDPYPEETAQFARQYRDVPIGTVAELTDLIRAANRALPRVTAPALVIQSKADQTVRPASAQVIYDRLGSRDKKLRWLRGSRHVATLDRERDLIHLLVSQHIRPST
ncbi:MAG TPA: alpha/beta fold hydrolase [Acidimicrobiia bacterium]|jgi:carboxylesterase